MSSHPRMRLYIICAAAGFLWLTTLRACAALQVGAGVERVGQFLDVTDGVRLRRGERELKAFLLSAVLDGDVIRVPVKGQAEVVLDRHCRRLFLLGGSVCQVMPDRIVTVNNKPQEEKRALAGARSLPSRMRRFAGEIYRGIGPPAGLEPVGGVRAEPVKLVWNGIGARDISTKDVLVEVREGDDATAPGGPVAYSQSQPANIHEHVIPAGKLRPGQPYVCVLREFSAREPGTRLFVMPLRLLTPNEVELLKELEANPRDTATDWLALAVAYERFFLFNDALRGCREAERLSPGKPGLAEYIARLEQMRKGLPPRRSDLVE